MNKNIPDSILFAVYGTLKDGYHNNHLLKEKGVTFEGTFLTEPLYTMISLGGYPAVYCEGNTSIHTELYRVTNPNVIRRVFGLEGYTGEQNNPQNWYDVTTFETPKGKASMFIFKGSPKNKKVVENGNW